MEPERVGDVVEHRHRERRRFLEDHADPAAKFQHVHIGREDVPAVDQDLAFGALAAVKFEDPVVDPQVGRFAAAGGADDGGDPVGRNIDIVSEQRLVPLRVEEVEVADGNLGFLLSVHGVSP
ncbi:hypothetical protein SDC9_173384 [bioreactor metagenome]|uniref:Uncharacterized protein n=1 Tax=bioreactor metagenome TaxID=1076179 RepID=A0A645GJ95_9ZZZZ